MTTPVRINLLPHREQKRQARQRQFISLAALMAILGLGIVGLVHFVLATRIESQNSRNALLKSEIVKLDEQIREIDKLRDQIAQVLARKQVVETLQANRNEAVHLLDQLVRQLPDGIYLHSIRQVGTKVTLVGYAQSNARVSTLMRNIEASPWVGQPELVEIKLVAPAGTRAPQARSAAAGAERLNEFTLNLQIKRAVPPMAAVGPAEAAKGQGAPANPAPGKAGAGQGAPGKAAPAPAVKAETARRGADA
jgi:type IV pilus assembly protein PilN